MPWWMWALLGLGLLAAETLTPGGFFVFFFGLSALLVAALAWLGIGGSEQTQWLLFSAFSVASLLLLRPRLVDRFRAPATGNTPLPDFVGDVAVLVEDLEPGGVAKAELRGTSWNARSHEHPVSLAIRFLLVLPAVTELRKDASALQAVRHRPAHIAAHGGKEDAGRGVPEKRARRVLQDHVLELVGQDTRQLFGGFRALQQAAEDHDISSGRGERVDRRRVEHDDAERVRRLHRGRQRRRDCLNGIQAGGNRAALLCGSQLVTDGPSQMFLP